MQCIKQAIQFVLSCKFPKKVLKTIIKNLSIMVIGYGICVNEKGCLNREAISSLVSNSVTGLIALLHTINYLDA
ncbi:MAG: hypothetical protein ACEY3J_00490 [Arsenophonus sp.]